MLYPDVLQTVQNSKFFQQPNYQNDNNNGIKNAFNGALHGNEAIDQPKQNPDHKNDNNDC